MTPFSIPITHLVVHHSASPKSTTMRDLREWHVEQNGWDDIGYHWVITSMGIVEPARPFVFRGAHARGHNSYSWSVCVIGDNTDERNGWDSVQVTVLQEFVRYVRRLSPGIKVRGHRDLSDGTECPGLDVRALLFGPNYGAQV